MNCFQKKKDCCVCYEKRDIVVKCKYCIEGTICHECYNNLSRYGQDKKCPCCRQDDWSSSVAVKTKVYPKVEERDVEEIDLESGVQSSRKLCRNSITERCMINMRNSLRNILYVVKALWIVSFLWIIGLFSMFMVGAITSEHDGNVIVMTIVPIIVGLIEIILVMCCCCNGECRLGFIQSIACGKK
uniref:Uncharacterized protein n=1 Tax=viral metagenome TaxID=1070528 RepID=A0A6C0CR00_9ZZZZ